ncbi:hemerythrin domain-containing protein [soil metagenome]
MSVNRRGLLGGLGAAVAGLGLGVAATTLRSPAARIDDLQDRGGLIEVQQTPIEDLQQEHAVLERVLLVYAEAIERPDLSPSVFGRAAAIVRRYIEDHHERDEEHHVFPRLERIGVCRDLVAVLRRQHEAGRALTSQIVAIASGASPDRAALVAPVQSFSRMYRPHAARETTVLFPAFRRAIGQPEYDDLRAVLEVEEHRRFGGDAFTMMLAEVAQLERELDLGDLARFTPT